MSYFVGILSGVGDIFFRGFLQVVSLLNLMFRGISESHKNPPKEENPLIDSIDNVEQYLWSELQLIQV